MGVQWSDAADGPIGGDLTAVLAYATPAGGAVLTPIAPIGLRDRDAGRLTFTTSLGFGRKLDRIRANPAIALAYHDRAHGFDASSAYVLVQGRATIVERPDREYLETVVGPAAARFLGAPRRGAFWDRWLAAYYSDRVPVHVDIERVVTWPDLRCAGDPVVDGEPLPAGLPASQTPPKKGAAPRVDVAKGARRLRGMSDLLLGYPGADGRPWVVPVAVRAGDPRGYELSAAPGLLHPGARRAGLVGHRYNAQLVGLAMRQHTGWLEVADDGSARYAPHTDAGFAAPANKTLLLLINGFLARRGLKQAQRARAAEAAT